MCFVEMPVVQINVRAHTQAQSRANQHTSRAARERERRYVREERGGGVLNCLVWEKGSIADKGPPQISTHSLIHEQDVRTREN